MGNVKFKETVNRKEYLEFNEEKKIKEPNQTAAISKAMPPKINCLPLLDYKNMSYSATSSTLRKDLRKEVKNILPFLSTCI